MSTQKMDALKRILKLSGKKISLVGLLSCLSVSCFAQAISETAALERSFTMIGFLVLILFFSGVALPYIKAHKKGSEGFLVFQIILNLMFTVLLLKIKDKESIFFGLRFLWLIIIWALVLINVFFFVKNTKPNSDEKEEK